MPVEGIGPHRIWYTGGRYAYASIHFADFSDHILAVVDMSNPRRPEVVGRWWIPGMWRGGAETPTWRKGRRYALHHALVAGNLAYGAWRDGGLTVLDVADPTRPKLLAHRNWDPPFGGGTHSPLPLPDRNLLVVADEPTTMNCSQGLRYVWMFDVREPSNPVTIATFPSPGRGWTTARRAATSGRTTSTRTGPAAFQSSRLIFATYYNAGVRVYDIEDPFQPREVGLLRAARSRAPHRSPAEPPAGDPVERLLRRRERPHVRDRQQRRPQHPRVHGSVSHIRADEPAPLAGPRRTPCDGNDSCSRSARPC